MKRNKKIAFFLLYWLLYSGLIQHFIIKDIAFNVVPDFILVVLLFNVIVRRKNQVRITDVIGNMVVMALSLLLLVGSVSMLVNGAEIVPYLWDVRFYLRGLVVFYTFWNTMDGSDIPKYKRIMYKAIVPNLLMCLYEWIAWGGGDCVGGIFIGGNSEMVLYLVPLLCMYSGDYYQKQKTRNSFLFLVLSSMFLAFIGEIKLLYILIPILVYAAYVLVKRFKLNHIIIALLLFAFFEPAMKFALSFFYDADYVENVFTTESTDEYTTSSYIVGNELSMNRSTAWEMTQDNILKDDVHKAFGYGIGASAVSEIFGSSVGNKNKITFFNLFTNSYLSVETGYVGYALFIAIYVILMLRYYRHYRKATNLDVKYWASMGILGCLSTFILQWYNSTPILNYNMFYIFFIFCFIAIRDYKNTPATNYE